MTWDVAGTDGGSVNCGQVDIILSTDGGQNFDVVVASGLANSGSAEITVPNNIDTTTARLMVKCTDNIFFDVSNANFTIESMPLVCTTDLANWLAETDGMYLDNNNNGIIDIIDLLICQGL